MKLRKRSRGQSGFTLAEMLVTVLVTFEVMLIAVMLLEFNSRITKVQTRMSDMQQSLRVGQNELVKMARLIGRGGLPVTRPTGPVANPVQPSFRLAVDVMNNVDSTTGRIAPNYGATPVAADGTDVLVMRGVFTAPLFHVNAVNGMALTDGDRDTATVGTVTVPTVDPLQIPQDLTVLAEAIANNVPEALVLLGTQGREVYAVVELDPANSAINVDNSITLAFKITGDANTALYRQLWTNDPDADFPISGANYVGILEEYAYYISEEDVDPGDVTDFVSRLSRARLLPNQGRPHGDPANYGPETAVTLATDIADDVLDLQVALGYDSSFGGARDDDPNDDGDDDRIIEDGTDQDDWLFNSADDDPNDVPWFQDPAAETPQLEYMRVSTLVRVSRPDFQYQAPILQGLEDRTYPMNGRVNSDDARNYRRRFLTTTVDMRNL